MLVAISPAKKLNETPAPDVDDSLPLFQDDANILVEAARRLSVAELRKLMHLSVPLAKLNFERFRDFAPESTLNNAKQAALIFDGDTYSGLDAQSLSPDDMDFAQRHLRILSGLYGVLRPLDLIQPYRLEMGSRLKTARGKSLYDFWGRQIAETLNRTAQDSGTDVLVNCASQEYFGAVDRNALKLRVIEPVFLEEKDGTAKVVSFYAKKARGALARFVIDHRIADPKGLLDFASGGYRFQPDQSGADRWVFQRMQPAPAKPAKAKVA